MPKTYSSVSKDERKERIPCSLCGSSASRVHLRCDGFTFVRCRACSLVYQYPRPVFDDLRRRYGSEYFRYECENEENFFGLIQRGLRDIAFDALAGDIARPRAFLDVGCATGMLVAEMQARGWNASGVDLCRESAEYGEKVRGVSIFAGTLEEARFPEGAFSAVHFSHLIEHVPDPRGFLQEIRRILKPGGYAIVTTPNIDGFQARLFRGRWRSAIADHLTLFSRRTLGRLLVETGFAVLRSVTWGGLAAGAAPPSIKRPMDRLAKRWGFGDVVLFLAQKAAGGERASATS